MFKKSYIINKNSESINLTYGDDSCAEICLECRVELGKHYHDRCPSRHTGIRWEFTLQERDSTYFKTLQNNIKVI